MDVLRVSHVNFATPLLFTDDEVENLIVRHEQIVVEQVTQTNNLLAAYVGSARLEFDFAFNIFYQETLEKLSRIRLLREEFIIYPFLAEEPLTSYTVIWGQSPTLREQWTRGRREAQWDINLTWKESRLVSCIVPAAS